MVSIAPSGKVQTWFITGASKGIGLEIAKTALASGHTVIGTARSAIPKELSSSPNFHSISLEVTDEHAVKAAVAEAVKLGKGKVDVIVNNAGYVVAGAVEEISVTQGKEQFATNVWGVFAVTQAFLPYLRKQGSGHIINVSSAFGRVAGPGWSVYAASKHAVEAITEALAMEVKSFGIKTTLVEPGYTRTPILASGTVFGDKLLPAVYDGIRPTAKQLQAVSGTQAGDPARQAQVIVALASNPNPPLHLPLGADSYQYIKGGLTGVLAEIEENKAITFSTDFPK